jgi:hypothetical protein
MNMAVSTQDIVNFLNSNPGMSDANIASTMVTYGVSPAQMATATGLSEGQVASRLGAVLPADQAVLFGDTYVQPVYSQTGSGMDAQQGALENVLTYKASENKTGGDINYFSPTGEFLQTTQQQKVPSFLGSLAEMANDPVIQALLLASGAGGALGGALGLTGSTAQAVGTGLLKGGAAAAGGASLEDALKTGLLSGGLVYGGNVLSDYISANTPINAANMTQAQFSDSLEGQLVKNMQDAGLSKDQISAFLNDMGIGQGIVQTTPTTTPITGTPVTTPASDVVNVTGTTTPAVGTSGLLSSLVTAPVTNAGTVNVTGTSTPQQVDASTLALINSQLASNVSTPANLPTVTVTGQTPATQQELINAITATLPNITPVQATTIAEQIITSGKPVTTKEVISAITAALPEVVIKDTKTPPPAKPPTKTIIDTMVPSIVAPTVTQTPTTVTPEVTVTAPKTPTLSDVISPIVSTLTPVTPEIVVKDTKTPPPDKPPAKTIIDTMVPAVVPTVTPPEETTTTTLGLTPSQILSILSGVGLLSSTVNTPTTPITPTVPTTPVPPYGEDYFTKVQQNYNRILPAVPRDVASPLRDWYTSQYGA